MIESNSEKKSRVGGKLRIGDHWNAINIIALSQNNPLKAIAEFVENSIDARAQKITIVRGKERGEHTSASKTTAKEFAATTGAFRIFNMWRPIFAIRSNGT